jgi:hypothetical protein
MSEKLTMETFRLVQRAIKSINADLEKATDKQLFTAAVVLAKIRLHQGNSVPAALSETRFEPIAGDHVPSWRREDLIAYLLSA